MTITNDYHRIRNCFKAIAAGQVGTASAVHVSEERRQGAKVTLLVDLRVYNRRMDWKENLLTTDQQIRELLADTKTIAVLGIKPESHVGQPAFYVAKYMQDAGYRIIPVPVYYPEVTEILGERVYRDLTQVPGEIDLLNVFRRSDDISKHLLEILAKRPKYVWFQLGIRNDEVAERLAEAGIKVVQDLCLMVEHRALT